jgi:hypothetical protein
MINSSAIQTAMNRARKSENNPGLNPVKSSVEQSSVISQLIFDIFGGEILKTHKRKSWHFYNRINGERIDFTKSKIKKVPGYIHFEDIPVSSDEIHNYYEQEQYLPFYMMFIREFEEALGLDDRRSLV